MIFGQTMARKSKLYICGTGSAFFPGSFALWLLNPLMVGADSAGCCVQVSTRQVLDDSPVTQQRSASHFILALLLCSSWVPHRMLGRKESQTTAFEDTARILTFVSSHCRRGTGNVPEKTCAP